MQRPRFLEHPLAMPAILIGIGLVLAGFVFALARNFVRCWQLTALEGIPAPSCPGRSEAGLPVPPAPSGDESVPIASPTPTPGAPIVELPPPWDGASRINILFIGLDYRDWVEEQGAPRSDTMILFTLDPVAKTGGMLSIPRDMWVNIPGGFGYGKINMAYMFGEAYKYPGGGPALAMRTVEEFIGVPVRYYAQIDFGTFERLIDEIGCIEVDVPAKITVTPMYGHMTDLEPGLQTMCGPIALAYARARNTEHEDIDRAHRQQQVILAIRQKVLQNLLSLVAKAPTLYQELSSGIHTNLSFDDVMRLAMLAKDIPLENIQRGVIDYTMAAPGEVNYNGQVLAIVRPMPDKIRVLRDAIFGGGAASPLASGDATQLMQQEGARVVFLNGTYTAGLAGATQEYFVAQGMNVVNVGNASYTARTIIIDHTGNPYLVRYLMTVMNITSSSQFRIDFNPNAAADVEVILGDDWALNNPMP